MSKKDDEICRSQYRQSLDDHKFLVELACSTTLVPAYHPALFNKLVPPTADSGVNKRRSVVFVVCGGFKIDLETAAEYQRLVHPGEHWTVKYDDGHLFSFEK